MKVGSGDGVMPTVAFEISSAVLCDGRLLF